MTGIRDFRTWAEHIEDPQVKAFFVEESQTRSRYASELESVAGLEKDDTGTKQSHRS
jgi:hypothetical protein